MKKVIKTKKIHENISFPMIEISSDEHIFHYQKIGNEGENELSSFLSLFLFPFSSIFSFFSKWEGTERKKCERWKRERESNELSPTRKLIPSQIMLWNDWRNK